MTSCRHVTITEATPNHRLEADAYGEAQPERYPLRVRLYSPFATLAHQLDAIGFGFVIPIFFIMVGVELDLPMLYRSERAALLVLGTVVVKMVAALSLRVNLNLRETVAVGVLLSARLTLIIAGAAIGKRMGVITELMVPMRARA